MRAEAKLLERVMRPNAVAATPLPDWLGELVPFSEIDNAGLIVAEAEDAQTIQDVANEWLPRSTGDAMLAVYNPARDHGVNAAVQDLVLIGVLEFHDQAGALTVMRRYG